MTTTIIPLANRFRVFTYKRLIRLSLALSYQEPVKIYIAALQNIYNVHYVGLQQTYTENHHGVLCIIRLDDNEISVCRLLLLDSGGDIIRYKAYEIPSSVSRVKPRVFQINSYQVIGHLCLEE